MVLEPGGRVREETGPKTQQVPVRGRVCAADRVGPDYDFNTQQLRIIWYRDRNMSTDAYSDLKTS